MKTRIKSGFLMVPFLIPAFIGGYVLTAACFVLSIFMVKEFYGAFAKSAVSTGKKPAFGLTVVSIVILYALTLLFGREFISLWAVAAAILSFICLFNINNHSLSDALVTVAGNFYVVFFLFHIALIGMYYGRPGVWVDGFLYPVWLVFFAAFGTDIFAYFTGVLIGKHKLCPSISPKKTVEGAIGGIIGSIVICGVYGYFALPDLFIHCIIIGLVGSILSMIGDLTASAIKRKLDIKDYGDLIPGHGGLLDRFDSVLFTAPFVYYYLVVLEYL